MTSIWMKMRRAAWTGWPPRLEGRERERISNCSDTFVTYLRYIRDVYFLYDLMALVLAL